MGYLVNQIEQDHSILDLRHHNIHVCKIHMIPILMHQMCNFDNLYLFSDARAEKIENLKCNDCKETNKPKTNMP
jgi:hypothetical protein